MKKICIGLATIFLIGISLICMAASDVESPQEDLTVNPAQDDLSELYEPLLDTELPIDIQQQAILDFVSATNSRIMKVSNISEFDQLLKNLEDVNFLISSDKTTNEKEMEIFAAVLHFSPPILTFGELESNWNWFVLIDSNGVIAGQIYPRSFLFLQNISIKDVDASSLTLSFSGVETIARPYKPFTVDWSISRINTNG